MSKMISAATTRERIYRRVTIALENRIMRHQWKEGTGSSLTSVLLAKRIKKTLCGALMRVVADWVGVVKCGQDRVEAMRERRAEKIHSKLRTNPLGEKNAPPLMTLRSLQRTLWRRSVAQDEDNHSQQSRRPHGGKRRVYFPCRNHPSRSYFFWYFSHLSLAYDQNYTAAKCKKKTPC